jgi:hypothetical protein
MSVAGAPRAAVAREPIHRREVIHNGYLRADGLWDIESEIRDSKHYGFRNADGRDRAPGEALHHMKVCLTLDDSLTVVAAWAAMPATPFDECPAAADPVRGLVGVTIGHGWRKAIDAAMGDIRGCTHVRELIAAMATVAFQTVPNYRLHQQRLRGEPRRILSQPGRQMGQCLGWDFDGPVIARIAPEFAGWRPPLKPGEADGHGDRGDRGESAGARDPAKP